MSIPPHPHDPAYITAALIAYGGMGMLIVAAMLAVGLIAREAFRR